MSDEIIMSDKIAARALRGVVGRLPLGLFAIVCFAGCASARPFTRAGGAAGPLAVRSVEWSGAREAEGAPTAVADDGDDLLMVTGARLTLLRAGVVIARVDSPSGTWRDVARVPAADGGGSWLIAVDGRGHVLRPRATGSLEEVGERWGLGEGGVRGVRALGERRVAFLLESELAIADGEQVRRVPLGAPRVTSMSGGGGRIALLSIDKGHADVRVLDATTLAQRQFALAAEAIALDDRGRLLSLTRRALYAEDAEGKLALRYLSDQGALHGLCASGARAWFGDGEELGLVERTQSPTAELTVVLTRSERLAHDARVACSPTGDAWILAEGTLRRRARDDAALTPAERWTQLVAPVFARSCGACHLPGGKAGLDLSTPGAWGSERALIRERVLEKRTMPPEGHPLADLDRDALRRWLDGA